MKTYWSSFSALDRYFGLKTGAYLNILTEESMVEFARILDDPVYPGIDKIDVLSQEPEGTVLISCDADPGDLGAPRTKEDFPHLSLLYEMDENRFIDPGEIYKTVRDKTSLDEQLKTVLSFAFSWEPFLDAAIMVSRYGYEWSPSSLSHGSMNWPELSPLAQKVGLVRLLESPDPAEGFELLRVCGFIEAHWPELHAMVPVAQGKEHHPEGNVWEHTLATFTHRKKADLRISLGLLLHDTGKPLAEEEEGRKFNRHAQLGRREAFRFMKRLGFETEIQEDVAFLVGQHMIPGISRTLPSGRIRETLSSPLYPLLLEVYRCDLSSTYRGPEGYYQACKVYRAFLKNNKNPFRDNDGKKKLRLYVE